MDYLTTMNLVKIIELMSMLKTLCPGFYAVVRYGIGVEIDLREVEGAGSWVTYDTMPNTSGTYDPRLDRCVEYLRVNIDRLRGGEGDDRR